MKVLKKRLTNELLQDLNVKLLDSSSWSIPLNAIEVSYNTVKRTTMDILMKMILITTQKAHIEEAEQVSKLLIVDELFVNDLFRKMMRANMISKKESHFTLTDEGNRLLEEGIFIHEPECESTILQYSPLHEEFLTKQNDFIPDTEVEQFRYSDELAGWDEKSIEEEKIEKVLKLSDVESIEVNVQIKISEITSVTKLETIDVPCLEFQLYNKVEDVVFVRVWNTFTEQWDEKIEAMLTEKELQSWREKLD